MTTCPCCSAKLLRHVREVGVYWFCPDCHQEMPNVILMTIALQSKSQSTQPTAQQEKLLVGHLAQT